MFDFTNRARKVISDYAPKEAKRLGHDYFAPEHILLGLLKAEDSVAIKMLRNLGVSSNELRTEIEKRCSQDSMTALIDANSNDRVQRVLKFSREEARKLRHSYIGSEHILLAILRDSTSLPASALAKFSITYQVIQNELRQTLGLIQGNLNIVSDQGKRKETSRNNNFSTLKEYSRNLTEVVQKKNVDPVIGRTEEIERLVQILARKTKNNPVLVGEAGVGKTAIVEGFAQRVLNKEIPERFFNTVVYALDIAALIAGTKYRGEFEDRLKKIMNEVRSQKNVVLFIDEIHIIIGAGSAEGAVDAANILKPALARGEIQCIGATTSKEYKRYIERDTALERRFQKIMVDEPSLDETMKILLGLRKSYELYHGVSYTKESIQIAIRLSNRFITDRHLPDKAIDILDEAGAKCRLASSTIPTSFKQAEEKIEGVLRAKNEMVKLQEYEKAADLRDESTLLREEYNAKLDTWRKKEREKIIKVGEKDVLSIVSHWTRIPLQQLEFSESKRLIDMEEHLSKRVIGQKYAIQQVSRSVRRSKSGFRTSRRPIGSFMFLGPSGVGKTELAKVLAGFIFGSENSLIRFDMSEYMESHSISKFVGSPPGYVGYDEGGQLTEIIRKKPYSVLLFDEIEKAHPDVCNVLLQVLDEAELTDTTGRKISFQECIIIMTSNIGARTLLKGESLGFAEAKSDVEQSKKDRVMEEVKSYFKPEFLNRLDETVIFNALSQMDMSSIVDIFVKEMNYHIIQQGFHIVFKKSAKTYFSSHGYDEKYGARPLKRLIQREIEDELSLKILSGDMKAPKEVGVSYTKGKLQFKFTSMSANRIKQLKNHYLDEEQSLENHWVDADWHSDPKKIQKGSTDSSLMDQTKLASST